MKITLTEARFQFLAGVINESEYLNQISEEVANATPDTVAKAIGPELKNFVGDLEDELEKVSKTENEALLTVASVALALPAIMGLIARVGKYAAGVIRNNFGSKPNDESAAEAWFAKLGSLADELHHLYMQPIEYVVKKFVKDPAKAHKISDAIFHLIVATMLIASGIQFIKALKANSLSLSTLEYALTAIKSGEIDAYLTKLFAA